MISRLIRIYPEYMAFFCTTILSFAALIFLWIGISQVLIYFFPAEVVLPDGTVERSEAMGQVFLAAILAVVLSIGLYIVLYFVFLKRLLRCKQQYENNKSHKNDGKDQYP